MFVYVAFKLIKKIIQVAKSYSKSRIKIVAPYVKSIRVYNKNTITANLNKIHIYKFTKLFQCESEPILEIPPNLYS